MPKPESRGAGWQGVCLVAITYVYFLIFAQFSFLKRLGSLGITHAHLNAVMAVMAAGGVAFSLLAPRITLWPAPRVRLGAALSACAAAALLSLLPLNLFGSLAVSLLIGCGLGLLTVTLVADLRSWLGTRNPLLQVGLGTGLGYLLCNLPILFTARPDGQAITAAALCLAGMFVLLKQPNASAAQPAQPRRTFGLVRAVVCFTALVWLDSAAFFIIQNTPALKAGTWHGSRHLWLNGALHLAAALLAVRLLRRQGPALVLTLSFLSLGSACILLLEPYGVFLAALLYPIGVSLYSVALVAYPSLLGSARSSAQRGRQAGLIYAIAGWFGSAMGIGMGQHLGHVPPAFVLAAGALITLPQLLPFLVRRSREAAATALVLLAAFCIRLLLAPAHTSSPMLTQAQRGRQVYISEGCIACHSQYVRPHSADTLMWGPAETLAALNREHPPLIGDRRQGPDLSQVGSRRSPLWLRAHLYQPAALSYHSFMPSYARLFRDRRGEDVLAYLVSLHSADVHEHLRAEQAWQPSVAALADADVDRGAVLFAHACSTCHTAHGPTRARWRTSFRRLPPMLGSEEALPLDSTASPAGQLIKLAQIVKFGLPGTDMPGHEYFSDRDVASLSLWLARTNHLVSTSRHSDLQ